MRKEFLAFVLITCFSFILAAPAQAQISITASGIQYPDGTTQTKAICSGSEEISVPRTGQTVSYATDDDGQLEEGLDWPIPRFTDNGDGTVRDNLTELIWLKWANCFSRKTWSEALSVCETLADGECGLSDGSSAGDWRLPNIVEIGSLCHRGYIHPSLPDTEGTGQQYEGGPFYDVQFNTASTATFYHCYWSGTTIPDAYHQSAWRIYFDYGRVSFSGKDNEYFVWPVRGGE